MKNVQELSFQNLSRLLVEKAGIRLQRGPVGANRVLLERAAQRAGAGSVENYAADLAAGLASIEALVEEARVGETYFYREPHQLDFLRRQLFVPPAADGRPLRLWSAGCASGEEAYTLAMMAVDAGAATEIVGSDISRTATAAAGRGDYAGWSLRGPHRAHAVPHLELLGERHRVRDNVRERVTFVVHNLVADEMLRASGGEGWDAILCRNVLIYFDRETQVLVIDKLARALAPGGWLLLGSCDPPAGSLALEPIVAAEGVFYRRSRAPRALAQARRAFVPAAWTGLRPPPRELAPAVAYRAPSVAAPLLPELAPATDVSDARATCLRGLAAMELGARDAALELLRKALFLEPGLVVAELATAALFQREGEERAARLGYRRALRITEGQPAEAEVPLASGATYADISAHCRRVLASLDDGASAP